MPRKPNPVTTRSRVVAGIRVKFVYDARRLDIRVVPNEDDFKTAGTLGIIRLWAVVGRWAESLPSTHPGWTVNGEHPAPDPDAAPAPEEGSPDEHPPEEEA